MNTAWCLAVSASWRFDAALAVNGLCHPPAFAGGAWSRSDMRAFRTAAACLSGVAARSNHLDKRPIDDMDMALAEVRRRLLSRDADCWPALAANDESAKPIDFSVLIGWGAHWWFQILATRYDPAAVLTRISAVRVIAAVSHAVSIARCGGPPAHFDRDLTRQIEALNTALSDLRQPRSSERAQSPNVVDIMAMGAARAVPAMVGIGLVR